MKDPLAQLEASKSNIEYLFKDRLTVTVLLWKHKENGDKEYASDYFNSATKTIINFNKYDIVKSFQEILYRIGNSINEASG